VAAARAGAFSIFVPSSDPGDSLTEDLCDMKMTDLAQTLVALKGVIKD